jgi:endonuclease YncB( thermonuclease family)
MPSIHERASFFQRILCELFVLASAIALLTVFDANAQSSPSVASDAASNPVLVARLVKVKDGDSLLVALDSGEISVRLDSVDAPEYDQPGGAEAAAHLAALVKGHDTVMLEVVTQDAYERLVAQVIVPGEDGAEVRVNELMVKSGNAWAYRRYLKDTNYCRWEAEAREAKRGLWALDTGAWSYPSEWRRRKRGQVTALTDHAGETLESCLAAIGK